MKQLLLLLFVGLSINFLYAQKDPTSVRLAFYNVENLFDIEDDSLTLDEEYTPEGSRRWSNFRYHEKLNHTAKAIIALGGWSPIAIIGLAEVENKKVLDDLVNTYVLKKLNYSVIHFSSPDRRGIDVAALYNPSLFTPLLQRPIRVHDKQDASFKTRDILYCKGLVLEDTVHIFFCHWPSRYGGQQKSEPKRILAANKLKAVLDSLKDVIPDPNIIIAGDFNDEWHNPSLSSHLKAKKYDDTNDQGLVNLMASLNQNSGSHRHKGSWSYLDQVIISSNLLSNSHLSIKNNTAQVFKALFLLEEDEKYPGLKPFRTFIGPRYNAGFSDHLPVYIDLYKN